ncbi:EF hand [Pseudoruegeria aquimaris]|uniref:EF hand n=1 Tax=Pseudoruegeria aquimaris TaxID=393663 RepID=A0A1Y5REX2_9RHOB|nr:hypothetical protein [Pseudoruegeria aquimaris]SLN13259.1 EF hand [Pseudoruegeria aquimaris]
MTGKRKALAAVLAGGLGILAGASLAGLQGDANGDGSLSYPEMVLAHPGMTRTLFARIDANGDGRVTAAEMEAAVAAGLLAAAEGESGAEGQ